MTSFTQPTVSNLKSLNMPAVVPHQTSAWLTSFHLFHVSANSVVPRKINTNLYSEHAVSNKSWEMLRREKAWNPEKGRERGCVGGSESKTLHWICSGAKLPSGSTWPAYTAKAGRLELISAHTSSTAGKSTLAWLWVLLPERDRWLLLSLSPFSFYSLWQTFIQSLCRSYSLRGCKA